MTVTFNNIVSFLIREGWESLEQNDRFLLFKPPKEMGFPEDYLLPVPTRQGASDYNDYLVNTVKVVSNFYGKKPETLFLDVGNYLDILKEHAVFIKLSSSEPIYQYLLTISHITKFLQGITSSFQSYTQVRFKQLFSEKFLYDTKKIARAARTLIDTSNLLLIDLEFKSFSFGVSVDTLMNKEKITDKDILGWKNKLLPQFEEHVLDADYYTAYGVNQIKELFQDPIDRRAIYGPIFETVNKYEYDVSITDSEYRPQKIFRRIPQSTVNAIAPKILKPEPKSQYDFFTIVVPVDEAKKSFTIRIKDLEDSLFTYKVDTQEISSLTRKNQILRFSEPLEVALQVDNEGFFKFDVKQFDISATADTFIKAQEALKQEIWRIYDEWGNKKPEFTKRSDWEQLNEFLEKYSSVEEVEETPNYH